MISPHKTLQALLFGLSAAVVAVAFALNVAQAQVSPALLQGMQWRSVGPFIAGKFDTVSGVNGNLAIAYAGADNGGVWKTTNAGTTWFPVTDAVHEIRGITALAVAPSRPDVVYAGTGSIFGDEYSSGVWKSTDAGAHWESVGLKNAGAITALRVDPHDANLVLASTRGVNFQKGGARGVFRSMDGGQTWKQVLDTGPESGASGLAWAYDNPQVVFATVVQTYFVPGARRSFGHPGPSALYKSGDEGLTWTRIQGRDQPKAIGEIAVADRTHSRRLYMLTRGGLYGSDDGGASWSLGTKTIYTASKQVLVDPDNPDIVYTVGTAAYRSTDGGHTLVAFKGAPGGDDPNQWWIDPTNPQHILYAGDQGAVISMDGGQSWSLWYNQATAEIYKISTDNRFPYWIYASKQDSGAVAVASRGAFGEINGFSDWFNLPGWETGFVTPDPIHPDLIFLNADSGFLSRLYRKTWQAQIIDPGMGSISTVSDTDFRRAVSAPIVFSPNGKHLYLGTQNIWESQDSGTHWRKISPDLTAHPGKPPEPNPEGVHHGDALTSLSPSTVQTGVIWTGSNNGVVYLTRDGGQHWQDVTPPGVGMYADVNVQASEFNPAEAYAAVDNSKAGDYAPHIYRTEDYGKSWQTIVSGLPSDQPTGSYVRVVREDPHKRGLLFAGTETSVYVSFDNGGHWQSLRLNLPTTSYRDLKIHDNDLIAGTYGRAIWILDDMTPLEQMRAEIASQPAHLFRPAPAVRVQFSVNQDTPFPVEVPHAKNPPQGAVIDYYLAEAAHSVQLQVFDASGNRVRNYSNAPIPPLDQPLPPVQSLWIRPRLPLPDMPGAHRVTWNLRYPTPPALRFDYGSTMQAVPGNTPFTPRGPVALPGNYTVKLTVDGTVYTQPLVVTEDPRVGDSPEIMAGMRKQLALAQNIISVMAASKAGYEQGKALEASLAPSGAAAANGPAKALLARVQELTGNIDEAGIGLSGSNYAVPPVKGLISFSRTNGQSSALLKLVNYLSDGAPVPSQYATYAQLCRDFNTTAAAWQALQAEISKLNRPSGSGAAHGPAVSKPVSRLTCIASENAAH
ncbi:MAG: WD40/YVTN/BNR-like repeat-containing protein [Gammaproteobacteria bacterium]